MRKIRWLHDPPSKTSANIAPLMVCVGLLLAPSTLHAQLIDPILPGVPAIPPILPGIPPTLPGIPPTLPGIPSILPGIPPTLPGIPPTLPGIPPTLPGIPPTLPGIPSILPGIPPTLPGIPPILPGIPPILPGIPPILPGIPSILPGNPPIIPPIQATCLPAISQACANLLNAVAQQVTTSQQVVTNVLASTTLQTTQQIADFALGTVVDDPIFTSGSAAVLRSITPSAATFGISGVSHTSHDGFVVRSPDAGTGRSAEFDSLDAGITLGMRFDASKALNWSKETLTIGLFGNYTNSDIDLDSNRILRDVGITRTGDASLNSGSGGGYAVVKNGRVYGLVLGSGEFGNASARDALLDSHADFDVSGFSSSAAGGVVLQTGPRTKLDLRSGLNYLNTTADKHTDSVGIAFGEGELDQFSGTLSARLFGAWDYGNTVVRPFLQGGVDYRFHYENQIIVENVKFELDEGRTTLFGRVGMDFDIGDFVQAYLAVRGDHNEDFDTVAGQLGFTMKLN
jgi:hypothetical protein